jgi:hypothetical protein
MIARQREVVSVRRVSKQESDPGAWLLVLILPLMLLGGWLTQFI